MATAEFAAAMPALVVVLVLALALAQRGVDQIRCVDAARVGVRLLARGDAREAVSASRASAPAGAEVTTATSGGRVTVTVTAPGPAPLRWMGAAAAPRASAIALLEQDLQ